ncbi:MAG TPA: hypothetical protein VFV50_18130 [Bdellovibrionales bacterium]|nr:hypothetical protein [Bdellovibrionales bacterium]
MIFWLLFACVWRILFASEKSVSAPSASRALHEKTIHSFSTYIGLLFTGFLIVFISSVNDLKGVAFADAIVFFLLAASAFASTLYLIRVARSYF